MVDRALHFFGSAGAGLCSFGLFGKGGNGISGPDKCKKTQFIEVRPITNITFAGSEEEDIYLYE